jgi:hypothetical protein
MTTGEKELTPSFPAINAPANKMAVKTIAM